MLFIVTVKKKFGFRPVPSQKTELCPCSPAPRAMFTAQEFHPALPIPKESGCIWYYTGWRTGNGSNSKGFKGQWKNSEPFGREIKMFHSSPLGLQCDMITWKSQQSSYKILGGKGTRGRPHLLFAPSCKEGEKTAWFAPRGHNCFSNQDKLSLGPE